MSGPWRVLDFSSFEGRICSERGAILVEPRHGESQQVPVADVAVVLMGINVSFSTAVIHRLTAADVAVLFCDWRGIPEAAAYAWATHTRVGARHLAQMSVSLPKRKNAWGQLIRSKVAGQHATLRNLGRPGSARLKSLSNAVRSGDPQNIEAQAARLYWQSLFDSSFSRLPGQAHSGNRNACLDYAYTVLRGFGVRAVLSAGLNPAIGVFHRGRSNLFNLVDDLIEPFRPCIDEAVARLDSNASPSERETKKTLVAAATQRFFETGETIPTVLTDLAQQYGRYIEGDIAKLHVPSWNGPSLLFNGEENA